MCWIILILILPAICHTATPRVQQRLGSSSLDAKAAFLPDWTDGTISNQSSSTPVSTPAGADLEIYEWWDCVIFEREARENFNTTPTFTSIDLAHFTAHP